MDELHRKLLNRLLAAWLAISLLIGGGVFVYSIENIDDQLVAIATNESERLTRASLPLLERPGRDALPLQRLAAELVREHFIVAELYDRERNKLVEEVNPRHKAIEEALKRRSHAFPRDDSPHYEKTIIGSDTVLQVVVPLKDAQGGIAGYFEGVFLIDPETIARLRRELAISLAVILGAVLLTSLALYPVILSLNRDVLKYSQELLHANIELMEVMGSAVAKRDSDTSVHNYRVAIYAVRLAEALRLNDGPVRDLIAGAFLHDVGKIGIADAILRKPGRLDESEFSSMRTHVALGVEILKKSAWLERARDVVEFHHEKFDGSGYLRGLRGEEIPLNARIFAIVDVFDALTSKRPYKEPMPFREAMAIIQGSAGTHFDPRLVAAFDAMIEPLFAEVSVAPDAEVEGMLRRIIVQYFRPVHGQ